MLSGGGEGEKGAHSELVLAHSVSAVSYEGRMLSGEGGLEVKCWGLRCVKPELSVRSRAEPRRGLLRGTSACLVRSLLVGAVEGLNIEKRGGAPDS